MPDSLLSHGLQHTRLPCPSLSPEVCSNSCPLSQWCHPIISSCRPSLLLPSIFPSIRASSKESVLCIRWPKYWSFSFWISPSNEYSGWFPLGLTGLIPLQSKELSRVYSNTRVQKHQFFSTQLSLWSNSLSLISKVRLQTRILASYSLTCCSIRQVQEFLLVTSFC